MAKYLIDLASTARYAGAETDIVKYADGNAATAAVFNAPPQNLRRRLETLRQEVEDLKYVADADRAMVLAIQGTLTATYDSGFKPALSSGGYLLVRPFISTAGAPGRGILAFGGSQVIQLSVGSESTAPKAWGQYDGSWGPAERGANAIVVTFRRKTTPGITITTDGADYKLLVGVPDGTTVATLVTTLNADALMGDLYLSASVLGNLGATAITLTTGTDLAVPIEGAADAEAHKITKVALDDFFAFSTNYLQDGDTLAIWYDKLVDETNGAGGRRQQLVTNAVTDQMLFNTRLNPERIPGCIPVATVVGTKLFLIDGTVMDQNESIGGSGTEYLQKSGGTISGDLTVQGSTTLGDGGAGDDVLIRGAGDTLAVGGSASTISDAPFRVTSAGAVTAASVAASGAITGASLDVTGTLTAGSSDQFQVSASGVITAPSISNGNSTLNVGTSGQTTAVQGDLTAAGNATVGNGETTDWLLVKTSNSGNNVGLAVGNSSATRDTALFKVQGSGNVEARQVSLGVSDAAGKLTINQSASDTEVITVTKSSSTKFSVDSDGDVTAAGAVTAASVTTGSGAITGGSLDVTGTLAAGPANEFQVSSAGAITAPSIANGNSNLNVGTDGYATAVQGNLTVAGATTLGNGDANDDVLIKGSGTVLGVGLGIDTITTAPFRVTASGEVTAALLDVGTGTIAGRSETLGASDGSVDGTLTIHNNTADTAVLSIKNATVSKFSVTSDGNVTAAGSIATDADVTADLVSANTVALSGVSVPTPYLKQVTVSSGNVNCITQDVEYSVLNGETWISYGAATGSTSEITAGTYIVFTQLTVSSAVNNATLTATLYLSTGGFSTQAGQAKLHGSGSQPHTVNIPAVVVVADGETRTLSLKLASSIAANNTVLSQVRIVITRMIN